MRWISSTPDDRDAVRVGFVLGPAEGQDTADPDTARTIQDWADDVMGYAYGAAITRGLKLGPGARVGIHGWIGIAGQPLVAKGFANFTETTRFIAPL